MLVIVNVILTMLVPGIVVDCESLDILTLEQVIQVRFRTYGCVVVVKM